MARDDRAPKAGPLETTLPDPILRAKRFLLHRDKSPFYVGGGPRAKGVPQGSPEDLKRLATFPQAAEALTDAYDGLGLALIEGDGIGCVDLDDILREDGELDPTHPGHALVIDAEVAGAYIEVSRSGRGLHIFGEARGRYASKKPLEVYTSNQFIALTGDMWMGGEAKGWVTLDDLSSLKALAIAPGKPGDDRSHDDGDELAPDELERVLEELRDALSYLDPDDREEWVAVGQSLSTLPDNEGFDLWLAWSKTSKKYRPGDEARWDGFTGDRTSYKSVFKKANAAGWKASRSVARLRSEKDDGALQGEVIDPQTVSEGAIAEIFAARHAGSFRFDHLAGKWFCWNGTRWKRDETALAFHFARMLLREYSQGERSLNKAAVAGGVERFARADPALATTSKHWDKDPMPLGTPKGAIELTTGELRKARPEDMITKLTGTAPEEGEPTLWLRFLHEALNGDTETIDFLQQWFGYCLTGLTTEHALVFLHGPGGNGKSVFVNTMTAILGDYAQTATMDSFTASKFDKHTTDLAMLKGARLVTASETEEGRAWAEARIKSLTGGDLITARFMRQDNFTYRPEFKLMIAGNHAPSLRNVDDAMKRRLLMVPFVVKPTNPNPHLERDLRVEHGRILRWAIEGCLSWQTIGLIRPKSVEAATDEYFADQDLLSQWLDECCVLGAHNRATPTDLFTSWSEYARARGEFPGTQKSLASELKRHGFRQGKSGSTRFYIGLTLPHATAHDHGR